MTILLVRENSERAFGAIFGYDRGSNGEDQPLQVQGFGPSQEYVKNVINNLGKCDLAGFTASLVHIPWPARQDVEHIVEAFSLHESEAFLKNALAAAVNTLPGNHQTLLDDFDNARGENAVSSIVRYAVMSVVGKHFLSEAHRHALTAPFMAAIGWEDGQ